MARFWSKLVRIAPYLLLGPISGLLVYAIRTNMQAQRPVLAGLYATLLVEYLVLLVALTGWVAPDQVALR